tara:strand:- start:4510 stop:4632 length:123 start_codon:yes stop_codon:yes gene_type:complete
MTEIIQAILEKHKDAQLNLSSEAARWILASEIAKELGKYK